MNWINHYLYVSYSTVTACKLQNLLSCILGIESEVWDPVETMAQSFLMNSCKVSGHGLKCCHPLIYNIVCVQ